MVRSAASKVVWVGRAAVFVVGLAVILALVFGAATSALGANGKPFLLGRQNVAGAVSTLVKQGPGPALRLRVGSGPPLAVNSKARVANLNAASAGRADSAASAGFAANADRIDNLDSAALQRATLPAVRANHSGQATSNNNAALLQFPGEDFDQVGTGQSGEMHSTTTNTSRLTAPRAGIYQIEAQVGWNPSATGVRFASLSRNSNGNCAGGNGNQIAFDRVNAISTASAYNHLGTLAALDQGDHVEVCVQQNSGADLSTTSFTFATMHYVSAR